MLTVHQLSKSYNINTILLDVSFFLNPGERVGLIGPNGSGKSTLLRILAGEEQPDSGHFSLAPPSLRIGYLPQGLKSGPGVKFGTLIKKVIDDPITLEKNIETISSALARDPNSKVLQLKYDDVLFRLQKPSQVGHLSSILATFELDTVPEEQLISSLSGGQKTRLSLALVLLSNPQLLLLDEPTNHLDIVMLEWIEEWLLEFKGGVFLVSHDRTFLEKTVTRILALDPHTHSVRSFEGAYTDYIEQVTTEHEKQWAAYRDQVAEIRRMKQDIARTKEQARQVEITTTSREPGIRRYAKKVAIKAKSREKKMDRYFTSDDRVEKPTAGWQIKVDFSNPNRLGKDVLVLKDISIGYPSNLPLLSGINLEIQSGQRIAFTGANGQGKTTLLRTIVGKLKPLNGTVHLGSSVKIGYLDQEQEILDPELTPVDIIRSVSKLSPTKTRNFLHHYLFKGDDALRPIESMSFGERSRLMLAMLVAKGCNFLLLDEPINHLDIPSREKFEQALLGFHGTVLAVVHDRYFINRFATDIWRTEGKMISREIISLEQ